MTDTQTPEDQAADLDSTSSNCKLVNADFHKL